jgi:hypothetical protein
MNDTALAGPAAPPIPAPKSAFADHAALVERWWADHFPGSPVAATTAAWNHAFAAKEELKRRLASLMEEH